MGRGERLLRIVRLVVMVYVFLSAIELFGHSMKLAGKETAEQLFSGLENPFAGLAVGILATVMVQSSSVTTSTVVAMVGAGSLSLDYAVPVIMGANIGTSITNTLVSLGHARQDDAFERAFAGATVHDVFNYLTTLVLFPIELLTHFLRKSAWLLAGVIPASESAAGFKSPIKAAVKAGAGAIEAAVAGVTRAEGKVLAAFLSLIALAMLIGALIVITKDMRVLIADRIEDWLNRALGRSGALGIAIGAIITVMVQSSSITTSLLVPLFAAGVLRLETGFPLMLGANIGTTITALIASTVTGPAGLAIALTHLLFNICGTLIFYPVRRLRRIPIRIAEALGRMAARRRAWAVAYVVGAFIVAPLIGVLIYK